MMAQCHNLEFIVEFKGNVWVLFIHCPMQLSKCWFHKYIVGMDEAKTVCKLSIVVLKVGFGVLITWAVTRNTGVLIFAKMMSQKQGSVRLCVESGAELSMSRKKEKKHIVIQGTSEKACLCGCLVTCAGAYSHIAYSVLSFCYVVFYAVFFNWRISVKFSGKRGKSVSTCWLWLP